MAASIKVRYAGECAHVFNCPGGIYTDDFKVVFDDKGNSKVTDDQWKALKAHAANAGIVKV